jgi:cytochrome P450 PksS
MAWLAGFSRLSSAIGFLGLIPALTSMKRYLERRLDMAREQGGEGLIAELVRAEREGGRISPHEMVSMVFLLLGAGTETTTHSIGGSVFELLKDPARRDWLAADESRLSLAVEEFLRFVSPVQFTKPRFVQRDIELEGAHLRKGDKMMTMLVAANFDPAVHARPERLDLERAPNPHLSFGTGIHFCLGHQLARIEAKCAIRALFQRWPRLELGVPASAVRRRRRPGLRAIERLPVVAGSA